MQDYSVKNGKDIIQRYRELLKQKQDEKCLPAFHQTFEEKSNCPNENIPPTKYDDKNHTLHYRGNAEFTCKRSMVHGKQFSKVTAARRPPQSQPIRASKNLQQLYKNSRKEAEEGKAVDASIDTLLHSSSSQCSVASLADEILNESFFDPKTAHPDECDFTIRSDMDDHTCGGLLSFLVDDSLNTITKEHNNIDETSKVSISEINSLNLERSTSKKFENDDSQTARNKTTGNTDDLERIHGENVFLIQRQMKTPLSEEIFASPSALSSSKSVPMKLSTDIEGLDVSRVVSDDDEELTVVSDAREPDSVANASSVFSWNSAKGKDTKLYSPFTALRCNSVEIALDESKQYARKIQELTKALEKAQGDISLLKNQRQVDKETIIQLSRQAHSKEEEMLRLLNKGMEGVDDRKLSTAKQHTEFSIAQLKAELQKEERRNESLLRRNETLIKESKFADQTCVELSCRNQALEAELERMSQELTAAREENEGLNGVIIRAAQYGSKLESEHEAIILEAAEQKTRLETLLEEARITVDALNSKNDVHINKIEQHNKEKALLELQLQDDERKIKLLESKLEQMVPCASIQVGVKETDDELTKETLHDKTYKVDMTHANHTPTKNDLKHYSFSVHTPTSHVLAKTLQLELMKGHHVKELVFENEKALAAVQSKYEVVLQELKLEKEKVFFLQDNLARATSDAEVAKQALAAWIDPLLFLKHDLQKLLRNGNSSIETDGNEMELEAIDDLSNAKVVARNITQEVTNLVERIFAERAQVEHELNHWKDLVSNRREDERKVLKNCSRLHDISGPVEKGNNKSQDFETSDVSLTFSTSCLSKPLPLSLNDAVKEKNQNLKDDLKKAQIELQQARKQLYLTKQECRLLSKKYEDSREYLRLNLNEKENLVREKEELINQSQSLEKEIRECHARIIELEEVNTLLANDLTTAKADLDESMRTRDELHQKLRFLESEREGNNSQLESAKIANDEMTSEIIALKECIHRANDDTKAAADKLTAAEKDADVLRMHVNNAEQKVTILEAELLKMSSLKDVATNESILLKQRLEQLEASYCMKCEEYDSLQDELQYEKTAFQARWDTMVQTRCAEETEMQETIVLIKAELMATKDEYDGIIDSLHKKIEESEQEMSSLRIELIKANAKKEGVSRRLSGAKDFDSDRLRGDAEKWQNERELLRQKTSELQSKIEELESKSGGSHFCDNASPMSLKSHDCKDCKYLRRILAREGKVKERESFALQKDLNNIGKGYQSAEDCHSQAVL